MTMSNCSYVAKVQVTLSEYPTCQIKIHSHDLGRKHLHWTCPKCETRMESGNVF